VTIDKTGTLLEWKPSRPTKIQQGVRGVSIMALHEAAALVASEGVRDIIIFPVWPKSKGVSCVLESLVIQVERG
jgi:hypothetical protein